MGHSEILFSNFHNKNNIPHINHCNAIIKATHNTIINKRNFNSCRIEFSKDYIGTSLHAGLSKIKIFSQCSNMHVRFMINISYLRFPFEN